MKKQKFVYVVTTIQFGDKYINKTRSKDGIYHSYRLRTSPSQKKYFGIIDKRTWGWYNDIKDAKEVIEMNSCDIYEGNYTYALIEKIDEGVVFGMSIPEEHWYKWKGTWEKGGYKPAKKPKQYSHIIHFMSQIKQVKNVFEELELKNPEKLEKESLAKHIKYLQNKITSIQKNIKILHDMESEEARKQGLKDALDVIEEHK